MSSDDETDSSGGPREPAGLSDPTQYRDRVAEDWLPVFRRRREVAAAELLSDALIAEHRLSPRREQGLHSLELECLVNFFQTQTIAGNHYMIYGDTQEQPMTYRVMVGRPGEPPRVLPEAAYASLDDAAHAVFLRRCEDLRAATEGGHDAN